MTKEDLYLLFVRETIPNAVKVIDCRLCTDHMEKYPEPTNTIIVLDSRGDERRVEFYVDRLMQFLAPKLIEIDTIDSFIKGEMDKTSVMQAGGNISHHIHKEVDKFLRKYENNCEHKELQR